MPFRGQVQLLHQHRGRHAREADRVDQERDRGQRQREPDHPPRRLQHDHHRGHRVELVRRREVVDVDDAIDERFVVEKDVEDEAGAERQQREIERAPGRDAGARRVQQEDERQREQQVRAAEDDRLRRAERRHVHVVERHRHRDRRDQPTEVSAGRRRRLRLLGDDSGRDQRGHVGIRRVGKPRRDAAGNAGHETGRPRAAPPFTMRRTPTGYIAPTSL